MNELYEVAFFSLEHPDWPISRTFAELSGAINYGYFITNGLIDILAFRIIHAETHEILHEAWLTTNQCVCSHSGKKDGAMTS